LGETRTFSGTVEAASTLHPHVILLDRHMPSEGLDFDFEPSTIKSQLLKNCQRILAMSFANDRGQERLPPNRALFSSWTKSSLRLS
jgi:hypothetical protein